MMLVLVLDYLLVFRLFQTFNILIIIAVVHSAAIFLYGNELHPSYIYNKVELIDTNKSGLNSISKLEKNATIISNIIVTTGKGSRTEIIDESSIWRLGSLSVGRWISKDDFWLHSGSALFCSKDDREIKFSTTESTAIFRGRGTIIIESTINGGYKFIPLEAKGTISTVKGGTKKLTGGRMILVLGNPSYFGNAYDIDIMLMLKSSRLINSFPNPLPSFEKIGLAIYIQDLKLKGKYDALIGDATSNDNLQLWRFGGGNKDNTTKKQNKKSFIRRIFDSE